MKILELVKEMRSQLSLLWLILLIEGCYLDSMRIPELVKEMESLLSHLLKIQFKVVSALEFKHMLNKSKIAKSLLQR